MRVLFVFETQCRDGFAKSDPVANRVLQRRIVLLHDTDHLVAVHGLHHLAFTRQTETGDEHLAEVLLLHEVLIQLLRGDARQTPENLGHVVLAVPRRQALQKCLYRIVQRHLLRLHILCNLRLGD